MNTFHENRFLGELLAAMEHTGAEPSIDDVKNGLLGSEDCGEDPTGNTGSPGDEEGNPVGPDGAPSPNPHDAIDANCPSGNPDAPGDDDADPKDPATEGYMDYLFRRGGGKDIEPHALCKGFIKEHISNRQSKHYVPPIQNAKKSCQNMVAVFKNTAGSDELEYEIVSEGQYAGVMVYTGPGGEFLEMDIPTKEVESLGNFTTWTKNYKIFTNNMMQREMKKLANASESETIPVDSNAVPEGSFDDFLKNVSTSASTNLIELEGASRPRTADGTAPNPGADAEPELQRGEPSEAPDEPQTEKGNCPSGNPDDPGVDGTPVLKGGPPTALGKNASEKVADDPTGNPDSPGVDAHPDLGFESFIGACERSMISRDDGTIFVPQGMTLESYAMEIGLGEIVARALEADLSKSEKDALPDSAFGLPKERKWPLNDESHVRQAIRYFGRCPQENQRELAKNILKAMRKFKMDDVKVGKKNPFAKYLPAK